MGLMVLIVVLVLIIGVFGLVALFSGIGDVMRRRRGVARDSAVIADSEYEDDATGPPVP